MKKPRKLKKQIKKGILIYDVSGMPRGQLMKNIVDDYRELGVVVWASSPSDNFGAVKVERPKIVGRHSRIKFVDVSK